MDEHAFAQGRPMRLRHSNASGRGYRRVAAGTGFSYKDLDGSTLPPGPVRERLEGIGIPPAWTDVWIAPYDNGHIQATGLDAVGRRQYIYHPSWRETEGPAEVRPLAPARGNPAGRTPPRHHGPALRGPHPGARAGGRLSDAGQRIAARRLRALHQRKRQPRPRHPALRPRHACARTNSGSASRPRAARPGSRGSTTPTSPPSCASSSAAAATPACWPTRTAGAGIRCPARTSTSTSRSAPARTSPPRTSAPCGGRWRQRSAWRRAARRRRSRPGRGR